VVDDQAPQPHPPIDGHRSAPTERHTGDEITTAASDTSTVREAATGGRRQTKTGSNATSSSNGLSSASLRPTPGPAPTPQRVAHVPSQAITGRRPIGRFSRYTCRRTDQPGGWAWAQEVTVRWFFTLVTPAADHATHSAWRRSAKDRTVPPSVTSPPLTSTVIS
jgi:hypothetical protein